MCEVVVDFQKVKWLLVGAVQCILITIIMHLMLIMIIIMGSFVN